MKVQMLNLEALVQGGREVNTSEELPNGYYIELMACTKLIYQHFKEIAIHAIIEEKFIKQRIILRNNSYTKENTLSEILSTLEEINQHLKLGVLKYHSQKKYIYLYSSFPFGILEAKEVSDFLTKIVIKGLKVFEKVLMVLTLQKIERTSIALAALRCFKKNSPEKYKAEISLSGENTKISSENENSDEQDDESSEDDYEDEDEVEIKEEIVAISPEQIKKLQSNKAVWNQIDHEYFFNDLTNEYYYNPWNSLGSRLKDHELSETIISEILDFLLLLYSIGIIFRHFPVNYFMVETESKKIKGFTFAMNYEKKTKPVGRNNQSQTDYIYEMKIEIIQLITDSFTSNYISNYSFEETFKESAFENQILDDEKALSGSGGFGQVYLNKVKNTQVAIKIPNIKKVKEREEECKARVLHELKIMKSLSHDYILKVFGITKYKNMYCLILEYVKGDSLRNNLNAPYTEKLKVMQRVAEGVFYMHSQSVCHYDIKPHNILLKDKETPKIIDFGLAVKEGLEHIKTGFTTEYADPEQYFRSNPGYSADIWAFGMTLYHVLTTKSPFHSISIQLKKDQKCEFYKAIQSKKLRPIFNREFSTKFHSEEALMNKCWTSDSTRRITADVLASELKKLVRKQLS